MAQLYFLFRLAYAFWYFEAIFPGCSFLKDSVILSRACIDNSNRAIITFLLVGFVPFGSNPDIWGIQSSSYLPLSRLVATRYVEISVIHSWLQYTDPSHWTVHVDLWHFAFGPFAAPTFITDYSTSLFGMKLPGQSRCLFTDTPYTIMTVPCLLWLPPPTCSHCASSAGTMYYH